MPCLKILPIALILLSQPISAAETSDPREVFAATSIEKAYILGQMRLFVESIQKITEGLATGDTHVVAEAAAARGRRMNAGDPAFPASLSAKLPPLWKQIGGGVRGGFDELSDAAKAGAPADRLLTLLAKTMTNCVACHQSYKIADTPL